MAVKMHPTDVPMKLEDVTLEIVKTAVYGCKWCELKNDGSCVDGSEFEPRTTMSDHPSCMSFEYDHNVLFEDEDETTETQCTGQDKQPD